MSCSCFSTLGYIIAIPILYFLAKKLFSKWQARRLEKMLERWGKDKTPKDVVILHSMPRAKTIPTLSPFAMKVETYLRMCGVKYEVDVTDTMGPKGKFPWISCNGEHVADSEFIVEFISKKFEKNLSKNINQESLAIATLCRITLEEYFFWGIALERIVFSGYYQLEKHFEFPKFHHVIKMIGSYLVNKKAKAQGLGLHSEQEVVHLVKKSLRAISSFLGNKKFICGDQPTELDAAIFGQLAQIIWTLQDSAYGQLITVELPNLREYCYRMKDKFWPDWDQTLAK